MTTIRDATLALWRRLPVRMRQRAAHALLDRLAPRLDPLLRQNVTGRQIPKIIVGFLTSPSGLGQSARLTAQALINEGHAVHGVDLSHYFHEKAGTIVNRLPDGKRLQGPAHVIMTINAPYLPYAMYLLGRTFLKEKYITGYWAWELPHLPDSWQKGLACVHDIAVPSSFVARAVRKLEPSRPVRVAPHPAVLDMPPLSPCVAGNKRPDQPFTIINITSVASGFERKNPLALIAAFKQAFGHSTAVRLRLLISNADHYPPARAALRRAVDGAGNIEIAWEALERRDLWCWWGTPDVYASLHRSEGFGLPLAEAMCAGYPVVATGWSGNMEFMTSENSFPVGFSLVDVHDPQAKYSPGLGQWAEADIRQAAETFRLLKTRPELAARIAGEGRKLATSILSTAHFSRQLVDSA